MKKNVLRCPNCRYEGASFMFENVGAYKMKCRRCRSIFDDPNAYREERTYADCDSLSAVTRFPFALDGSKSTIHVRKDYLALLNGYNGQREWLTEGDHLISDYRDGFSLYYINLRPRILWGTRSCQGYGAYGRADLIISSEYVKQKCDANDNVLTFEEHIQKLVNDKVTEYICENAERRGAILPEQAEGWMNELSLEEGLFLTKMNVMGYRSSGGTTRTFPVYTSYDERVETRTNEVHYKKPVDFISKPSTRYTVRNCMEEVIVRSGKMERHKKGEEIENLKGINAIFRFKEKKFEYPFGWGVFNQNTAGNGFFSAHGSLSFYIDSTEKLSELLLKTASWEVFTENFFSTVRRAISDAIKEVHAEYADLRDFSVSVTEGNLSSMSVDLMNFLNGEGNTAVCPAFRQYGLRVEQIDIFDFNLYSVRR